MKSSQYLFKLAEFLNKSIPGFEKAQIIRVAETTLPPAGRSIENELCPASTMFEKGMKNDDVIAILQRGKGKGVTRSPIARCSREDR